MKFKIRQFQIHFRMILLFPRYLIKIFKMCWAKMSSQEMWNMKAKLQEVTVSLHNNLQSCLQPIFSQDFSLRIQKIMQQCITIIIIIRFNRIGFFAYLRNFKIFARRDPVLKIKLDSLIIAYKKIYNNAANYNTSATGGGDAWTPSVQSAGSVRGPGSNGPVPGSYFGSSNSQNFQPSSQLHDFLSNQYS